MAKKKTRSNKARPKKTPKRAAKASSIHNTKSQRTPSPVGKTPIGPAISLTTRPPLSQVLDDSRVFTIEIDSIRAETTIGDLIVAFPRTRDVLMKHGLRFEVEEAGYLYMTLNVFSAIHGLTLTGLLEELDVASKELPLPPLAPPPVRQIASPPTT